MQAVIREMPKHWLEERRRTGAYRWDEMWDGTLHVAAPVRISHQVLVRDLISLLSTKWAKPSRGKAHYRVMLVTSDDERNWTSDYRIPDVSLLSVDRLTYQRVEGIAGPPLVCVEIKSPNDESYDKMPYYARLGVPEAWVIDCDTKKPEVFMLESGEYKTRSADAEGWMRSECVGLRMKEVDGKLWVLFDGDREHVVLPE